MAAGKRPVNPQEDLAEARRRAKAAKTPIAKAVREQVVEKKERAYSGKAAKEASTSVPRATAGKSTAAATSRRTPARQRSTQGAR